MDNPHYRHSMNQDALYYDSEPSPAYTMDEENQLLYQQRRRLPSTGSGGTDKNTSQVFVKMQIVFLKLGDIDTVNELFNASVFVQAKWNDPNLDDRTRSNEVQELQETDDLWMPKLAVRNSIGETEEKIWYIVSYDKDGFATVYERRTVKGKFYESMELDDYPFDSQDLTITVSTSRSGEEIRLIPDDEEKSSLNEGQEFTDAQEWFLFNSILIRIYNPLKNKSNSRKDSPKKENLLAKIGPQMASKFRFPRPQISVSCKALRRWEYFGWNVILIMLLIGGLVFTTFSVDFNNTASRLQMSFVLLLSNITFKMAATKNVPQVSYLTKLDKYIIGSLLIMSMVCIWHAIVSHLPAKVQAAFDFVALAALVIVWLMNNIYFFFANLYRVKKLAAHFSSKQRESILEDEMVLMDSQTGSNIVYVPNDKV